MPAERSVRCLRPGAGDAERDCALPVLWEVGVVFLDRVDIVDLDGQERRSIFNSPSIGGEVVVRFTTQVPPSA